jgi:hypothetical protein
MSRLPAQNQRLSARCPSLLQITCLMATIYLPILFRPGCTAATAKTPSVNASSPGRFTALPAQPAAGWPAPGCWGSRFLSRTNRVIPERHPALARCLPSRCILSAMTRQGPAPSRATRRGTASRRAFLGPIDRFAPIRCRSGKILEIPGSTEIPGHYSPPFLPLNPNPPRKDPDSRKKSRN